MALDPQREALAILMERQQLGGVAARLATGLFAQQCAVLEGIDAGQRFHALRTSRQSGKTWTEAVSLVRTAVSIPGARCLFLGITFSQAQRAVGDHLHAINATHGLGGEYVRSENYWRFPSGGTIGIVGADHAEDFANRFRGAQFDGVVIDEASMFPPVTLEYLWDRVLRATLIKRQGWAIMGSTPYKYRSGIYYIATSTGHPEWRFHTWSTFDNPAVADQMRAELESAIRNNPGFETTDTYREEYLGEWSSTSRDRVYSELGEHNLFDTWEQPEAPRFVTGLDLGYNDAVAIVQACTDGQRFDVIEAHLEAGMLTHRIAEQLWRFRANYPGTQIIVDPASKTVVEDLRQKYEIPLIVAQKTRKHNAIQEFNSALARGLVRYYQRRPGVSQLVAETRELPWKFLTNGDREEYPGKPNDGCDAALYAWRFSRGGSESEPKEPAPTPTRKQRAVARAKREARQSYWQRW